MERTGLWKSKGPKIFMFEKYPAGVASVYLQMFQLQTEDGWEELAEVLANDPRVTIR